MNDRERVEKLADKLDIEVRELPDYPKYCRLIMPSRISPGRMLPPLLWSTAVEVLNGERKSN